ncbi:Ig-like domain-containing protein [Pantoea dispersa]|uniref:Ig-like domain-containing protein n=1 Tax=Pantoea dispersa TaxID=59814 RepID=UPI002DBFB641|nr:Ig-like domain-containing protein [Pantoea dispersa]MEB5974906.1 Ig-like domain-containing protein [Pantoea dispersa]
MDDINLAIVSGKRIIQAENLPRNTEKPVTVKAVDGARYVLIEGESLTAPEIVCVQRVGNDLHLMLQGRDSEKPNLIIEDYYPHQGDLVGLSEDGQWHAFSAVSADHEQDPRELQDGEQSTVVLDSTVLPPLDNLEVDSNALAFGMIALGAAAAAAAVAALAVLVRSNGNHDSLPPPAEISEETKENPETQPEADIPNPELSQEESRSLLENPATMIDSIQDDMGEQHGTLLSNDVTDDNTPTLKGSGQQAGSVIEIQDNGSFLGTAIADSKGNWSFTPESPLLDGTHAFVVIITEVSGVVSAPSDPAIIIIASDNAMIEPLSLGDLLPLDTDLSDWAQISAYDDAGVEHHNIAPDEDASRMLDELLSNYLLN